MPIIEIEDDFHAEPQGRFESIEAAVAELKRRAVIPWGEWPNRCPCQNSINCHRMYVIFEYDDQSLPWTLIRRLGTLEISASSVSWSGELEGLASR